jgi:plasmid stabilization system protein ParE
VTAKRLPVRFHPDAAAELLSAAEFFGTQGVGLGSRFLDDVDRALVLLRTQPEIGTLATGDIRLWSLRTFPYRLAYRVKDATIEVLAVAHHRRRPRYWRRRGM